MNRQTSRTALRAGIICGAALFASAVAAPMAGAQTTQDPGATPGGLVVTHQVRDNSGQRVGAVSAGIGGAKELNYTQQVQQNDEWCWAADGSSIEQFHGAGTTQDEFCGAGKGVQAGDCPNQPAEIDEIVRGFQGTGFNATSANGSISWQAVQSQIDNGNPALTGIYWTSGGGHAEVIYGYDSSNSTLKLGDPWPTYQRYQTSTYNNYLRNSRFTWADTVVDISQG
ncbi:papain-like cysteine protease family protein [Amycolatopsis sp. H20-H5]|uniref:papain-like cysteine protease family protein n=1 Tax=Amycolatopsis sp. H20-H5 TaxID=3046309 RepID=UPI002DBA76B9|nr:papain-like cysteine protease family protein [Amycolatopsis sp. H20-H5]MEC3980108.1 papain-like cysteine protease family protein [Amycolatopsis sp. H20-H5]